MRNLCHLLVSLFAVAGCQRGSGADPAAVVREDDLAPAVGGAISAAPIVPEPAPAVPAKSAPPPRPSGAVDWSTLQFEHATVGLSCDLDYQRDEVVDLTDFSRDGLRQALEPCAARGVLRLSYRGRIDRGFGALVERVTVTADELQIGKRVLDLDSAGGQVEDAIRSGDFIAESRWTIWVREDAICHSACVLVLGAGDNRVIAGKVGVHRIIRMSSTATTRAELNAELNLVHQRVRSYLERNGVAVAVADLMMAVPNRRLRLLSGDELRMYGLDGVNPVQDDLDRLRLLKKCGPEFLARRDAFLRAFERRCNANGEDLDALNSCGLGLRSEFGFPDGTCPAESPLSEFDTAVAAVDSVAPDATTGPPGVLPEQTSVSSP